MALVGPGRKVHASNTSATGPGWTLIGDHNTLTGPNCKAVGDHNTLTGPGCSAKGDYNRLTGPGCSAEGDRNRLTGPGCSAEGEHNVVLKSAGVTHFDFDNQGIHVRGTYTPPQQQQHFNGRVSAQGVISSSDADAAIRIFTGRGTGSNVQVVNGSGNAMAAGNGSAASASATSIRVGDVSANGGTAVGVNFGVSRGVTKPAAAAAVRVRRLGRDAISVRGRSVWASTRGSKVKLFLGDDSFPIRGPIELLSSSERTVILGLEPDTIDSIVDTYEEETSTTE